MLTLPAFIHKNIKQVINNTFQQFYNYLDINILQ